MGETLEAFKKDLPLLRRVFIDLYSGPLTEYFGIAAGVYGIVNKEYPVVFGAGLIYAVARSKQSSDQNNRFSKLEKAVLESINDRESRV